MATYDPPFISRSFIRPGIILIGTTILEIFVAYHFINTVQSTLTGRELAQTVIAAASSTTQAYQQTEESSVFQTATALAPTATPTPTQTFTPTPTPTITPSPTSTPKPGTVRGSKIDGMSIHFIPAGQFDMGVPVRDGRIERNDQPRHKVYVDAFWIGRTAVTNAQYSLCQKAGACGSPIREEINPHYFDSDFAKHPVVYITWTNAAQYCSWVGGRLPTEAEWEHAAGGSGRREYAWGGDDPGPTRANIGNLFEATTKVGSFPDGASPYGVLDMGGNVREWVLDFYDSRYYRHSPEKNPMGPKTGEKHVLKGGSWSDPPSFSRVTTRLAHVPESAGSNRGFRCLYPGQ